jgi:hypothetical protein
MGFIKKFDLSDFSITFDYSKLLTEPIPSLPKIWVNDVDPFHYSDNLHRQLDDDDIKSLPNKQKDNVLQQLIEDGNIAAIESPFVDVDSVGELAVVEDLREG